MEDDTLGQLLALTDDLEHQLATLRAHLASNPDADDGVKELCAELEEALASSKESCSSAQEQQQQQQQQPTTATGPTATGTTKRKADDATAAHAAAWQVHHHQQQQQPATSNSSKRQRKQQAAMHPANLYAAGEPDFAALAAAHPPLARHLIYPSTTSNTGQRPAIDFTSWEATKDLTAALLRVDFGVAWDLPARQLVPPVPNRANYIHWVADLLQLSSPTTPAAAAGGASSQSPAVVSGLDIGCGANLIYCLLGAAIYGWRMVGVDVTDVALTAAQQLIDANPSLGGLLEVRRSLCEAGADLTQMRPAGSHFNDQAQQQQQQQQQQQGEQQQGEQQQEQQQPVGPLMGVLGGTQERYHFCMCNPPFFESLAEANQNPNTACGGTAAEMVVPGGELAFVRAMIADSRVLQGRVHWYTSMCGKKGSMKVLRQELHSAGVTALRTTELVQGKTSRWAIAWSFTVPASTANMPLPRAHRPHRADQQPQQQGQGVQEQQVGGQPVMMGRPIQPPQQKQQESQSQGRLPSTAAAGAAPPAAAAAAKAANKVSFTVEATAAEGRKVLQALAALLTSLCGAQQLQTDLSRWSISCQLPCTAAADGSGAGGGAAAAAGQGGGGVASVEVNVYQQRKAMEVVARVVAGDAADTCSSDSSRVCDLAAAMEQVRADMGLMWSVSEELRSVL